MSFEQLYRQLFPDLHRYAFTILNDSEWATDVVQDAFLKYYQQIKGGTIIEYDKAYLYRVVYNTSVSLLRKKAVQTRHTMLAANEVTDIVNIEERRIAEERDAHLRNLVNQVLEALPGQCRHVFLKSRTEGKKYKEIATEMNLSVKTVEAHMSKALKIIQEFIRVNRDKLSLIQIVLLYELFS